MIIVNIFFGVYCYYFQVYSHATHYYQRFFGRITRLTHTVFCPKHNSKTNFSHWLAHYKSHCDRLSLSKNQKRIYITMCLSKRDLWLGISYFGISYLERTQGHAHQHFWHAPAIVTNLFFENASQDFIKVGRHSNALLSISNQ